MKKRNLIISFLLLGTLASCASEAPKVIECPECPECPTCEEPKGPSKEQIEGEKINSRLKEINNALAKFNSDFTATFVMNNSRKYLNPFNVLNNVTVSYKVTNSYDFIKDTELVRFQNSSSILRENEDPITVPTEEGLFNKHTNTQVFEYLDYKNTLQYKDILDESNSAPLTMDGLLANNIFENLEASAFDLTSEGNEIEVNGSFIESYISSVVGYSGGIKSLKATLLDGAITKLDFVYDDYHNRYSNQNFGGDRFVESLSGSVEFTYKDVTISGKQPVGKTPVESIEKVLNKFKENPTNYTIQYGSSADMMTHQILRNGDKIALDVFDLMGEANLGTLSWLDARVEKNEDGTYHVNNVVMDEKTGETSWLTNEQIIDQSLNFDKNGQRLPENQCTPLPLEDLNFDISRFDLDFRNIDTSLLTDDGTGNYVISGDSAKYFGESLIHRLCDESGFGISLMLSTQFTWCGTKWSMKALDENSIAFTGEAFLDLNGATSKSSIYGVIKDAGTTNVDPLYGELPKPQV